MPSMSPAVEETPEMQAKRDYNYGVREIKGADAATADAAKATDPAKQQKLLAKANARYGKALGRFESAVAVLPDMHEAWNYIGYAKRRLGDADAAIAAYDRALALAPQYAPALEYRGVAYLGAKRLDDAKGAYLALFASDRKLADELLGEMRTWITARRASPDGVDAESLDAFARWVDERATVAGQTAALAPTASADWR